jgi:hypothetical protein
MRAPNTLELIVIVDTKSGLDNLFGVPAVLAQQHG